MGISSDEIAQTRKFCSQILISDQNAFMNKKGIVIITESPPEVNID